MTEKFTQEFWDERYRSRNHLWSGKPNPHLVGHVSGLGGGTALDVGSGEGAEAIWLAERGWWVTALDVSTVALERGASHAAEAGVDVARRINWLHEDLMIWKGPEPDSYDLVTSQFLHLPKEPRESLFRRLAASVSPGGTLLIVGHHPSDLQPETLREMAELCFTASEVAALLDPDEWEIIVEASVERPTINPGGHTHDAVLKARRRD
ncbi:MAG: class I SAM-dependent methyltransferase [Rubrobacteraceae bacterium]